MKRWLTIAALSVFTIWVGSGCGSVRNVKEINLSITGLEMEFYPEHGTPTMVFDLTVRNGSRRPPRNRSYEGRHAPLAVCSCRDVEAWRRSAP